MPTPNLIVRYALSFEDGTLVMSCDSERAQPYFVTGSASERANWSLAISSRQSGIHTRSLVVANGPICTTHARLSDGAPDLRVILLEYKDNSYSWWDASDHDPRWHHAGLRTGVTRSIAINWQFSGAAKEALSDSQGVITCRDDPTHDLLSHAVAISTEGSEAVRWRSSKQLFSRLDHRRHTATPCQSSHRDDKRPVPLGSGTVDIWPVVPMHTHTLYPPRSCRFCFDATDGPTSAEMKKLLEVAHVKLAADMLCHVRPATGSAGATMVLYDGTLGREVTVRQYADDMVSALQDAMASMSIDGHESGPSCHVRPTVTLARPRIIDRIRFYDRLTYALQYGRMSTPDGIDALTGVKLYPDPQQPPP